MFRNAALPQAECVESAGEALWDRYPALLSTLHTIVADAADGGRGARLVVANAGGTLYALVSVGNNRYPWRVATAAVLEGGETVVKPSVVAAPVHAVGSLRGALLLHCYPDHPDHPAHTASASHTVPLLRAHAARLESALTGVSQTNEIVHGAVDALAQALAAHDPDTARHSRAVARMVGVLGHTLGLPASERQELEWAAVLHDVGKIAVPMDILQRAGPLNAAEWGHMREHPAAGERIVQAVPHLGAVSLTIRHHHERWDGSGYPDRVRGTAIPLQARLVALVDAYECMLRGRPYRPARQSDEALRELQCSAGSQFDPALLPLLPVLAGHSSLL